MGRGKVELKRIQDKVSRQVSFTKRRNGLMKKAHELSVLCDVDVAVFVFSGKNRLSEFSTGDSMPEILNRYQDYKQADEAVRKIVREELTLQGRDVRTVDELTRIIQRDLNEHKVQHSDVTELCQLEKQTESVLRQVRTIKTQLMLGVVKNLQEEQKQLRQEKQLMVGEVANELLILEL
ncbi:protein VERNALIZATION 1-like [Bidens hawaiensis]|uniref:protein VERNALIZATION 1-like n=1 Tax=Bidens hawaiensis TaxID=980011 RepID=UPI00404A9138